MYPVRKRSTDSNDTNTLSSEINALIRNKASAAGRNSAKDQSQKQIQAAAAAVVVDAAVAKESRRNQKLVTNALADTFGPKVLAQGFARSAPLETGRSIGYRRKDTPPGKLPYRTS